MVFLIHFLPGRFFPHHALLLFQESCKAYKYRNIHEQKVIWNIKDLYHNIPVCKNPSNNGYQVQNQLSPQKPKIKWTGFLNYDHNI